MNTLPPADPNGAPYVPTPASNVVQVGDQNFIKDESGNLIQAVVQPLTQPAPAPAAAPTDTDEVATELRQQVEGFLKTANIQVSQVEQEIQVLGTISESTKKALVDKHGAATANLVIAQVDAVAKEGQAQAQALQKLQHDTVQEAFKGTTEQSGAESWKELVGWARENIPADTRKQLNAMMKNGAFQAKQAVDYMINELRAKTGTEQTGDFLDGNGAGAATDTKLLSAREYSKQLAEVVKKHGYDSPQVQALQAQRLNSRKRGV